jgi:hypothetical protein
LRTPSSQRAARHTPPPQKPEPVDHDVIAEKVFERMMALEAKRAERPKAPAIHVVDVAASNDPKVVEAALCLAGSLPDVEKKYDAKVLEAADLVVVHSMFRAHAPWAARWAVAHRRRYAGPVPDPARAGGRRAADL